MHFRESFGKELLIFDGAMGTQLQQNGLRAGELPELWNITHAECVSAIHRAYIEAGCDVLTSNTFGANALKFKNEPYSAAQVVAAGVGLARAQADAAGRTVYVALDMGPTGKLLAPYGDLPFDAAYALYREQAIAGAAAGADFILIETMGDLYEIKAAVLAAKENTHLPVVVTMIFDEKGKLLTGADVRTAVVTLEGLGVDGIGLNCGLGPQQMHAHLLEMLRYSSLPVCVSPNAGLPECINGVTRFQVEAQSFAEQLCVFVQDGASAVGGCCGTTPAHMQKVVSLCRNLPLAPPVVEPFTAVTSYAETVQLGGRPVIIGERINPTGKSRLKEALRSGDTGYIFSEAVAQADCGAEVLDVNVGLPELDEPTVLCEIVQGLQSITTLPLQLDTANITAMERALRIYNGKPLINSVNGKRESMEQIFPLAKKYGGVVVCLTLDENGIPQSAQGRIEIAERIVQTAAQYGIEKKDLLFDTLAMTVSTGAENAEITLKALHYIRHTLGVNTVLGVSNISFGLPKRDSMNAAFFTMALHSGLSAGIVNPKSDSIMNAYYAYCALKGFDRNFEVYIAKATQASKADVPEVTDLNTAVRKGLKAQAASSVRALLADTPPLEIIDRFLIPALDAVGTGFEQGTVFLPQLLMSADAAKAAFEVLKAHLQSIGDAQSKKGKIVLATVQGDIHDIGKNIVKVLLENYGFEVLDLGKDVAPEAIVDTALREQVRLVGLSALMTTTVANMEVTIQQLHAQYPACKIMVGGAVLTQAYAQRIGADFYSGDAMGAVRYAESVLGCDTA